MKGVHAHSLVEPSTSDVSEDTIYIHILKIHKNASTVLLYRAFVFDFLKGGQYRSV